MDTATITLPDLDRAEVVVPAPDAGPGNWAGAASATVVDDLVYLTYRVRRPLPDGRGVSTVVARSRDGVHFETVSEVWRDAFGAESFERPVVLRTPAGTLAPLRLLRHPGQQALVDRGDRRRPARGLRDRSAHRGPLRLRHGRRQGPRHRRRRRRRLARLDLRAPADRGRSRGPDVARRTTAATTAWSGSDAAPSWRPGPAPGTRAGRGSATWSASTRWSCCTTAARAPRTTGTRRPAWRGPR